MTKRITINVETQKIYADEGVTVYDSCVAGAVLFGTSLANAGHTCGWEVTEELGANLIAEIGRQLDEEKQGPPPWRADT
ncbi:Uncharacterised protein [Corynebacterium imitans]|uniref:Uncharacterized protein n=1 Tax=Corynebacterium imitans TaxID=156978 RepID=A0A076NR96_9CORY|nr:hypothetical protein [Corynebacterium imitans]AIJ33452.1 hypothetical protein CIMIT_05650 [Corynebacterium imitans]SNV70577.1 Uncharacterised protein [Corynebacterium imitans]